jgi:hypothetical protein
MRRLGGRCEHLAVRQPLGEALAVLTYALFMALGIMGAAT